MIPTDPDVRMFLGNIAFFVFNVAAYLIGDHYNKKGRKFIHDHSEHLQALIQRHDEDQQEIADLRVALRRYERREQPRRTS